MSRTAGTVAGSVANSVTDSVAGSVTECTEPATLRSIDLFSGTGGLTLALSGIARPVLYCDSCPTSRALLEARMASCHLPRAPIAEDVEAVRGAVVPQADMVVGGFPCIGFSSRGRKEGFANEGSALFYELIRVVRESGALAAFLENVPAVMGSIGPIREEFSRMGFAMRWCVVGADSVGAPHLRKRWFALAYAPGSSLLTQTFRPLSKHFEAFDWTAAPPPRTNRLADAPALNASIRRWGLLGNGVVPSAARLAFFRLISAGHVTHLTESQVSFVDHTACVEHRCTASTTASSTSVVHACTDTTAAPTVLSSRRIQSPPTRSITHILLDPHAMAPPSVPAHNRSTPALTQPVRRRLWATPRHGKTASSRVLTARTAKDLPTQIRFEQDTVDRSLHANADFGDYMMGLPAGYTDAARRCMQTE